MRLLQNDVIDVAVDQLFPAYKSNMAARQILAGK